MGKLFLIWRLFPKIKISINKNQSLLSFLRTFYHLLLIIASLVLLLVTYFLASYIFNPNVYDTPLISRAEKVVWPQSSVLINILPTAVPISTKRLDQDSKPTFFPQRQSSQIQKSSSQSRAIISASQTSRFPLTFGVYYDDFPNTVYINQKQTTLHQDLIATAIMFPPIYQWHSYPFSPQVKRYFSQLNFNKFTGPYSAKYCLGNNCLVQKRKTLYYNQQVLNLPEIIKSADISAISISALQKRWLVGFTLRQGQNYQGVVFFFDGHKFTKINTPTPVLSSYFGLWGFGGEENDFLMIYGAYQGIAYRVQEKKLTNISRFFAIRAMNGGFQAQVIRVASQPQPTWYVYSLTLNRPQFFKLWQNDSPQILGEIFFPKIFNGGQQTLAFKLLSADSQNIRLLSQMTNSNSQLDRIFIDQGFNNIHQGILLTTPISNQMLHYRIKIQKIYQVQLKLDAVSKNQVQWLFSSNTQDWQSLIGRQYTTFNKLATPYYLKVIFPAETNRFYSPYLDSMLFSYYWRRV